MNKSNRQTGVRIGRNRIIVALIGLSLAYSAQGGVPLNSLQGNGGVAFNPLAYPVGQNQEEGSKSPLSKPQFGAWYVNLGDVNVDWTAIGVAETFFNRLELSYGYEAIAQDGAVSIHKDNLGAKLLLIPENAGGAHGFRLCRLAHFTSRPTTVRQLMTPLSIFTRWPPS